MLYIAVTIFPVVAIISGVVSLVSVVRFVAQIYQEIRVETR
jgi:hypothetical protein